MLTELHDWLSLDDTVTSSKWGCLSAGSYTFSEKWVSHNFCTLFQDPDLLLVLNSSTLLTQYSIEPHFMKPKHTALILLLCNWLDVKIILYIEHESKSWFTIKDPDAGKDWRQKEKRAAEDELVGWHHRLNGHELEQASGVSRGQRSLACYRKWSCKDSDTT